MSKQALSNGLTSALFALLLSACGASSVESGDGGGGEVTVNHSPVVSPANLVTAEDQALSGILPATDVDDDRISYQIISSPEMGIVSLVSSSTGTYTYTPFANVNGVDSFSYSVSDGQLESEIAVITITIEAVNDLPVGQSLTFSTLEDMWLTGRLKASDVDNSILIYSVFSPPSQGVVTIVNATSGDFIYVSNENVYGIDSFSFIVNDGFINSVATNVSISITAVNDAPVAVAQTINMAEDAQLNDTLVGTDVDSDSLIYALASNTVNGQLTLTDAATGAYSYSPNADFSGSDSFTFTVNDGVESSTVASVSIDITAVNDAPVAVVQTINMAEDTQLNDTLVGTDVDSDSLTYALASNTVNGQLTLTNAAKGAYSYNPNADFNGSDSFTFTVNDGVEISTAANVSIGITAVNDAPVAVAQTVNVAEDTQLNDTLVGTDVDSDSLIYALASNTVNGQLTLTDAAKGAYSYSPNADFSGSDSFTFTVNDGVESSTVASVSIDITAVNDAPVAVAQTINMAEDAQLNDTLVGTDVDSDSLTYALASNTVNGQLTLTDAATGAYSYSPNADFNGSDSFTFTVNDGVESSTAASVSISITAVNDAPVAVAQTINMAEDTQLNDTLVGTDVDSDSLSYALASNTVNGQLTLTDAAKGAYSYSPNADFSGSDSFTFTVNDGVESSIAASVSIVIAAVNDAPVAVAQTINMAEDAQLNDTLVGTDVDSDSLIYALASNTVNGQLTLTDAATGAFSYSPNADFNGSDSFTFTVNDGVESSTAASVSIVIAAVNDTPVAVAQTINMSEDTQLNDTLVGTDVDSDSLIYALASNTVNGQLILTDAATGAYSYSPNADFNGSDSFTFTVNDGVESSTAASVSIGITAVNDAPVASSSTWDVLQGVRLSDVLVGNDVDSAALTFSVVSQPSNGTLTLVDASTGQFTYIASADVDDSFSYQVSDGSAQSGVAIIDLQVTGDPHYKYQWHLENTGQTTFGIFPGVTGEDINIVTAVADGSSGAGVIVAVVDSGLEINHEDLADNIVVGGSHDFVDGDNNPFNSDTGGDHGTSVAGIIAARGWNDKGGRGVAAKASLKGFNVLKNQSAGNFIAALGGASYAADVAIFNQSYGVSVSAVSFDFPIDPAVKAQLIDGVTNLRGGKGALYIKSAGNSYSLSFQPNVNMDPGNSTPYTIVVAALNAKGRHASYSSMGSAVLVSAPGGEDGLINPAILTTDQESCTKGYGVTFDKNSFEFGHAENLDCNYTSIFNGTSSAAPMVSGVVALMLEANPNLSWRDVRHILVNSSDQVDSGFIPLGFSLPDGFLITEDAWITNTAGLPFHNWYGFGHVNAGNAVVQAKAYTEDLDVLVENNYSNTPFIFIPDDSVAGAEDTVDVIDDLVIEAIQVSVTASHSWTGDLGFELTSPGGTKSILLNVNNSFVFSDDLSNFVMLTNAFYGESSDGVWVLKALDGEAGLTGTLESWTLTVYGH